MVVWGWGVWRWLRLWLRKQVEIVKKKKIVTVIQNENTAPIFRAPSILLLDILEIIQLSEMRLFDLNKRLRAAVF